MCQCVMTLSAAGPFPDVPEAGLDPEGSTAALADDLRFFYRHIRSGGTLARLDEVHVVYRHHSGQLTHSTPRSLITAVKVSALILFQPIYWLCDPENRVD